MGKALVIQIIVFFDNIFPVYRFGSKKFFTTQVTTLDPAGIYLLKVNNRNSRTRCEYVQS